LQGRPVVIGGWRMLKRIALLVAFFFFAAPVYAECGGSSPNWTAATWAQLGECFTAATGANDIITITANLSATSGLTWNPAGANAQILGQGYTSATGGGDVITITDNNTDGNPLFNIYYDPGGNTRIAGLTFEGGTGTVKSVGLIAPHGPTTMRVDHMHFDMTTYSTEDPKGNKLIFFGDRIYGVMDHNILDLYGGSALYFINGIGPDGMGNTSWASDTDFGESNFFFIENNVFNGHQSGNRSRMSDSYGGSRIVVRFNELNGTSGPETHATGHSGDDRGLRATESYYNTFSLMAGQVEGASYDLHDASSGTHLIWGNTVDTDALKNGVIFNVTRKNYLTYAQSPPTTGWGFCGPTPVASGTVNVSGTAVTRASGSNFDTGWPSGSGIIIVGAACDGTGTAHFSDGPTSSCEISSVGSTTALTLTESAGTLTGAAYYVASSWDQNSGSTGYACIDQPGRGKGELLTGYFPTKVNSEQGNTIAWPNQALEPVYVIANSFTPASGEGGSWYVDNSGGRIVADRDYYEQASGVQTNATTPFNGTTKAGWGTIANRPTTCTAGVAYLATDEGSWNTSGSGGQGLIYKCTATDTWTLFVTPYTYPHPLVGGTCDTPTKLLFSSQPFSAYVGNTVGTIAVGVYDADDNLCSDETDVITLAKTGGTCTGMTLNGDVSGANVFTTTDVNLTVATGSCSLTATADGLTDAVSDSFTISTAPSGSGGGIGARLKLNIR